MRSMCWAWIAPSVTGARDSQTRGIFEAARGLGECVEASAILVAHVDIPSEGEGLEMMKKVGLILIGTLFVVACGQTPYTSSPSPTALVEPPSSGSGRTDKSTRLAASLPAQGQPRVGFGFNGTVSGFPTGEVFLTGGGAYNRTANFVDAAGGFKCLARCPPGAVEHKHQSRRLWPMPRR